jgi:(p)ppGpp synthase/HD superfamily hydrolase
MPETFTDLPLLTDRFDRALHLATGHHRAQLRKGTEIPYVSHLLAVTALVLEMGGSEDEAIAALLHDAVEDQGGPTRLEDIRGRFGERVAQIVEGCSDSIREEGEPKADWWERKCAHLDHLAHVDGDLAAPLLRVSMADKLSNLRATVRDAGLDGDGFWKVFKHGAASQLWYYGRMNDIFRARCPGSTMLPELEALLAQLAEVVPEADRALAERYRAERCL